MSGGVDLKDPHNLLELEEYSSVKRKGDGGQGKFYTKNATQTTKEGDK